VFDALRLRVAVTPFEVDGRAVCQRAMSTARVVPALDVGAQRAKGIDISSYSQAKLNAVARQLNAGTFQRQLSTVAVAHPSRPTFCS
jgi:hypothetical protein